MSYRRRCKRSRLCLLSVFERMPSLGKGGHRIREDKGESGDIIVNKGASGCSGGQRTSDPIEIGLALFLQGCAFFLKPDLASVRESGWLGGDEGEGSDARFEFCFFVGEFVVDSPFDLTGLL